MAAAPTLRGILRLLAQESDRGIRLRLGAALGLAALGSLLAALAPLSLKQLIDSLGSSHTGTTPVAFAALYLAALWIGRLFADARPLLIGGAEQRLQARLSRRFFAHVLALPVTFHLERQTGALAHSLAQTSAGCQLLVANLLQALPIVIELVAVIAVLAHLDQPALVASFVASAGAYAITFGAGARRVKAGGRKVVTAGNAAYSVLADALINIETIKCFNAAPACNRRFAEATTTLQRSWLQLHRQRAGLGVAVSCIFGLSVAASLLIALHGVQRGSLTMGGFVLVTAYMLQMVRPVEMLGTALRDITQAIEFISPVLDILRIAPESQRPCTNDEPAKPAHVNSSLTLSNVHLSYGGGQAALDGLDLHVPEGASLAIVGPSGSGKTSVVKLLLRLLDPSAGCVMFGTTPLSGMDPMDVRAMVGVVPQDLVLLDDTIEANIRIGCQSATAAEIEEVARRARIDGFVESLPDRYATRVGERGLRLSGGQRQRIAIARALLRRPNIFVFDEATSALDLHTEEEILEDLRQVCRGSTTVIVTHRLSAARHADRIAVLERGRITDLGSHDELMRRGGTYARMWSLQARTIHHEAAATLS